MLVAEELRVWHGGNAEDLFRLEVAIKHNCVCVENAMICQAHLMLNDQHILDRFAFVARNRDQFVSREWLP